MSADSLNSMQTQSLNLPWNVIPPKSGLMKICFDEPLTDQHRRKALHDGQVHVYSANCYSTQLATLAQSLCEDQFFPHHPRIAHRHLGSEELSTAVQQLNEQFKEHPESDRLVAGLLAEMNCVPQETLFCQPSIEVTPPGAQGVLLPPASATTGDVGPSAKTIRMQNWWLPIYPISPNDGPVIQPPGADREGVESANTNSEVRIACPPGALTVTCAARLCSAVSNTTAVTQFSIVFRSVNATDLERAGRNQPSSDAAVYSMLPEFRQISEYFTELHLPDWWSGQLTAVAPFDP